MIRPQAAAPAPLHHTLNTRRIVFLVGAGAMPLAAMVAMLPLALTIGKPLAVAVGLITVIAYRTTTVGRQTGPGCRRSRRGIRDHFRLHPGCAYAIMRRNLVRRILVRCYVAAQGK